MNIRLITLVAIILVVLLAVFGKLPRIPKDPSGGILSACAWVCAILLIHLLVVRVV